MWARLRGSDDRHDLPCDVDGWDLALGVTLIVLSILGVIILAALLSG